MSKNKKLASAKKLSVRQETLRRLTISNDDLAKVAGGMTDKCQPIRTRAGYSLQPTES
jgi:hypothetical protein